jgi:hypothetical protein
MPVITAESARSHSRMLGMSQQSEAWAAKTTEVVIEGPDSGNPNEYNVPTRSLRSAPGNAFAGWDIY